MMGFLKKTGCALLLLGVLAGCQSAETGTLDVVANGEDFVREGFVSVDGWEINFDELVVSVEDVTVWRSESPYDVSKGELPEGESLVLEGSHVADLTAGADSELQADGTFLVGRLEAIPTGHYNAISWEMNGSNGQPPLQMVGTAEKDGAVVQFDITVESPFAYRCGEYVGDGRKGFVKLDQTSDIEMTFHLDHVFGDFDSPADDALNQGALGFEPLAALAADGTLTTDLAQLKADLSAEDYERLEETLHTLGHVGEGHCFESAGGYTGE